ncbi:MAG: TolC family protein [Bacteroidota bacterium]
MLKIKLWVSCVFLIWTHSAAQTSGIDQVLRQVEQNNRLLKVLASENEARSLALATRNNLSDPVLSGFYLPWGEHNTADYYEFQIDQRFEFPSVYAARGRLIEAQRAQQAWRYASERQQVLLDAATLCYELIYMRKKLILKQTRLEQARLLFERTERLFAKDEVDALEMNKAKVVWLQLQFDLEHLKSQQQQQQLKLREMNGGKSIQFELSEYPEDAQLPAPDSLWQAHLSADPSLAKTRQHRTVAQRAVSVSRRQGLPDLLIGMNYQGVASSYYYGVYAGISIPIWSNRNQLKAAKAELSLVDLEYAQALSQARMTFEQQLADYRFQLERYKTYQQTIENLESEKLLRKAYVAGEITYIEYYMERQFYHDAYDHLLLQEKRLHLLRTQLLKHEL